MPMQRRLWVMVGVVWAIWASRAHNLLALPVFVDESLHILRAQMVFEFSDATASFLPGKLLLYYYLGLFAPQDVGGLWVARQAVVLLVPLGAVLTYRLARTLFPRERVAWIALALYALSPFLLFFERMALADTFTMVWGLALAISLRHFARTPTRRTATISGVLLGMSLLSKLTALLWGGLPWVALWLWHPQWRTMQRHLLWLYGVAGLCLLPSLGYVVYQEVAQLPEKQEVVTTTLYVAEEDSRLAQIIHNGEVYAEAIRLMLTLPIAGGVVVGLGWGGRYYPRPTLYVVAMVAAVWGLVLVTSARPSTRYLVVGVPPLLILAAAWLAELPKRGQVMVGVVYVASAVLGLNFMRHAWNDPTALGLAERDVWEYHQNATTGYAYRQAAPDLAALDPLHDGEPVRVGGFVAACHSLRLYLPASADVEMYCPYFKWREEFAPQTLAEWSARLATDGVWYILADDDQPLDLRQLPARWTELAVYERPFAGASTRLYRVEYVPSGAE